MTNILKTSILILLVAVLAFGQATTTQTTLSVAVTSGSTAQWCLTSATGVVVPSLADATSGSILFVDKEAAQVTGTGTSSTCFKVKRGQLGTSAMAGHGTSSVLWVGAPVVSSGDTSRPLPGAFVTFPPTGTCTATAQATLPVIVTGGASGVDRGQVWNCYGSVWTRADADLQRYQIEPRAAPPTTRLVRSELLANYAGTLTGSGNLVGVRGAVTLGTGTTVGGSVYVYGVQGKVITSSGVINNGSAFTAGVFGQLDVSGGTVSAGHVAPIIGEIYGLNSGTSTVLSMGYFQHAGGGVANSMISMFGKATYVFDISTNTHTQANLTCQPANISTTGALKVIVDGTVKYIPLVAAGTCP